ncbi:MAG: YebC/PmpR family DNA-binding transcriptional regulator [Gammaproteobacteria bacterium]
MAGHSKWANIQHRKGAQDRRRGQIFNKLIREISVATRIGGADQGSNARLRIAVDKARARSVPVDSIESAIRLAISEQGSATLDTVRYEGYGPGGAALMVDCLTDNRDRTTAEVRQAFAEVGGNLGADGSVAYLFNQVGFMIYPPGTNLDRLMEAALDAGAEDVLPNTDGSLEVLTDPLDFQTVRARLMADGLAPAAGEITQRASSTLDLNDEDAVSMVQLLETLEDMNDVQDVYSNAEIPDEVLARV